MGSENWNREGVSLNGMVKELLQAKGPELEKEKVRNRKFLERSGILPGQLDMAVRGCGKAKGQTAFVWNDLGGVERENGRMGSRVGDLAIQVRSLLKETETQRGNSVVATRPTVSSSGEAEVAEVDSPEKLVFSKNLIKFRHRKSEVG